MRATLAANSELVGLYLEIGRKILEQQRQEGWGTGVIGKLADDLRTAFPDMKGFSPRNLSYMRQAAEIFGEHQIFATSCCKIALGTYHGAHQQAQDGKHAPLVRPASYRAWLVPCNFDHADRKPFIRTSGKLAKSQQLQGPLPVLSRIWLTRSERSVHF